MEIRRYKKSVTFSVKTVYKRVRGLDLRGGVKHPVQNFVE